MSHWPLVLGLTLAGCRAGVEGTQQLEGGVGGCFSLVDGTTCVTRDPGRVVVWVESTAPGLHLRDSTIEAEAIEGGTRWIVPVSEPIALVVMDADNRPRFEVDVVPAAGPWREAMYTGASCAPEPEGLDEDARAFFLSGRARCAEEADQLTILEQAIAAHRARGDGLRVDWDLAMWGDLAPQNQPVPGGIWLPSERSLESRYFWGYHHGRRANAAGNLADAHRYLDDARAMAWVLEREDGGKWVSGVTATIAENLSQASRHADALAEMNAGLAYLSERGATEPSCAQFSLLSDAAWFGGLSGRPIVESMEFIHQAEAMLDQDASVCPVEAGPLWHLKVNRAYLHAQAGQNDEAERILRQFPPSDAPDAPSRGWAEVFAAELALQTHRPEAALQLVQPHISGASPSPFAPPAHAIAARAYALQNRPDAAVSAYRASLAAVESLARRTPLGLSRGSVIDATTDTSWRLANTLHQQGQTAEAFAVLRAHRRRSLLGLRQAAVAAGSGGYRGLSWDDLRTAHDSGEASLETWELDSGADALETGTRSIDSGLPADVAREMERFLQSDPSRPAAPLRGPAPAEVFVLVGIHDGTLEVWTESSDRGITRVRQPAPPSENGQLDAIVAAIEPHLRHATHIVFMPIGEARALPLARAVHGGAPLGLQLAITTSLDLAEPPGAPEIRTAAVLADPTHDLAAARTEGRSIARALDGGLDVDLRIGEAATDDAMADLLTSDIDLVHFAGHAAFADDGWSSGLALAGGSQLAAWQLLALPRVPPVVSMTACESSRTVAGQAERLGLAQAFVLAGSQAVLAADVPVADDLAHTFGTAWATALADGAAPPDAWRTAAQATATSHPDAPWWTLRLWTP